jgi:methionyl-tRNA synthetase
MDTDRNKFYVTTPIYYVTAKPHLGSLYSTLLADVIARWNKLYGKTIFFLTGTDEHGQKIAQAASKEGLEPKKFVESFISSYKDVWSQYRLDYTYFIRTTDIEHIKAVQLWLQKLIDKGDVYKAFYEGWYCVQDEAFVTDEDLKATKAPLCPLCARETVRLSEESYFFKLSAYQEKLLQFYAENPNFIVPKERTQEVINFVKSGLRDLSISRTTITWGIPFPGNEKHITYVWADALNNYITALGYGQPKKEKEFNFWWPADLQILGKDILRFHAVYWPAFLMASDLALPKHLLVHGWINVNNEKMSKSRYNVVDPKQLADTYGVDQVRYYLMRQFSITQDSNFSLTDLEQRVTSDLAHDLSNLLNRMTALTEKNQIFVVEPLQQWSSESKLLREQSLVMLKDVQLHMQSYEVHMALGSVWKFIGQANAYFHAHEPWKLIQKDKEKFLEVIAAVCHSLRIIGILLWPVIPSSMEQLLLSLGSTVDFGAVDTIAHLEHDAWNTRFTIQKIPNLFNKIEPKIEEQTKETEVKAPEVQTIDITDLAKVELRVGMIEECKTIEKSDKLYKLHVNFGPFGIKQILSGIRAAFQPEQLVGKQAVFVFNLKPRMMMGLESQGMILTAKDDQERIQLVSIQTMVPNGTRLQ